MRLVDRAKNMIVTPRTEWDVIAAEPTPPKDLVTGYVLPLAAVAALASFVSAVVIGTSVPMLGTVRQSIAGGVVAAVLSIVMAVVMVFVMGFIIDALAPTFGGQKSMAQAVKVAAYSYTPVWILAIVAIIPYLGILVAIASIVLAIYLLYLGLPRVMHSPQDKAAGYTALVVIVALVVGFVIASVVALATTPFRMMGAGLGGGAVAVDRAGHSAQLDAFSKKMQEANRRMDEAQKSGDPQKQMEAAMATLGTAFSGGKSVEPVQLDTLKPMLPEQFVGLPRTSQRADRSGVAGLMAAKVEGDYGESGSAKRVHLGITDTGGAAGLVGLAAWATLGASSESEDDAHIERMRREGKRLIREEISKSGGNNSYSVILADRFVVEARGHGVDEKEMAAAVNALDLGKLEAMK